MENDAGNLCNINVVDLWKYVYVIFEILLYHTWIHSFLMFNVNLSFSGCLVDRLAIAKWCRHAGRRRMRRCEYRGLAWGFILHLCFWTLKLGLWLRTFVFCINYIMLDFMETMLSYLMYPRLNYVVETLI